MPTVMFSRTSDGRIERTIDPNDPGAGYSPVSIEGLEAERKIITGIETRVDERTANEIRLVNSVSASLWPADNGLWKLRVENGTDGTTTYNAMKIRSALLALIGQVAPKVPGEAEINNLGTAQTLQFHVSQDLLDVASQLEAEGLLRSKANLLPGATV